MSVRCADGLPYEIWTAILSWLQKRQDVQCSSLVCRRWNVILERIYWQRRLCCHFRQFPNSSFPVFQFCGRRVCVPVDKFSSSHALPHFDKLIMYAENSADRLPSSLVTVLLSQQFSTLRKLQFYGSQQDATTLLSHPGLQNSLEHLDVPCGWDEEMAMFMKNAKRIKSVRCENVNSDHLYETIADRLSELSSLELVDVVTMRSDSSVVAESCLRIAEAIKLEPRTFFARVHFSSTYRNSWLSSTFAKVIRLPSACEHTPVIYFTVQKIRGQLWTFTLCHRVHTNIRVCKPEDNVEFQTYFIERYVKEEFDRKSHLLTPRFRFKTTNYEYSAKELIFTVEVERVNTRASMLYRRFDTLDYGKIEKAINERLFHDLGQSIRVRILDPLRLSSEDQEHHKQFQSVKIRSDRSCELLDNQYTYSWCAQVETEIRQNGSHSCRRKRCKRNPSLWIN